MAIDKFPFHKGLLVGSDYRKNLSMVLLISNNLWYGMSRDTRRTMERFFLLSDPTNKPLWNVFSSLRYGSPTYWRSWIQSTKGQNEQHPANYFRVARIKLWLFGQRCRMSEIFTVSFCWRIEFSTHHLIYRLDKPWMSL